VRKGGKQIDLDKTIKHWWKWAEQEVGGPPGRVEAATRAAIGALTQGKSPEDSAAAAREAAAKWGDAAPGAAEREMTRVRAEWLKWAEREIGGPDGRVGAAMQAITAALTAGKKNPDDIVAAARQAAANWDRWKRSNSGIRGGLSAVGHWLVDAFVIGVGSVLFLFWR